MRHRVSGRKFGLPSDQRRALLKGLVRSLFLHDAITTTETRAKDVRPIAEKLITLAKRDDIHARRLVRRYIDSNIPVFGVNAETRKIALNPDYVVPRLFNVIAPRYKDRQGGYSRITKIGARRGDGAPMVVLELMDSDTIDPGTATTSEAVVMKRRGLFGRRK
ncbi:MAG: 50S ribosomal protein L17 [Chthonomonadales bacterium]|nr:50S ribosomal protein L17 [Chthonomonadales bacterium]